MRKLQILMTLLWAFVLTMHAQTVQYLPLYTDATFSNKAIDLDLPVGHTEGAINVLPTGGASYTIPITLPPGTKGVVPSVSVVYNSQSGNGMMGMGWNIAGLSAISRTGKNMHYDGQVSPVKLNYEDFFALDGNRLEWDAATSSYRTKMETFSKVTSFGNSAGSPDWFKVEAKNGMIYEYGNTVDSKYRDENNTVTISWQLNKMSDQYGNYVSYVYEMNGRELRIKEINYTGNASFAPYNKIAFSYQDRTDKATLYLAGSAVASNSLLTQIMVTTEGSIQVKKYAFEYGKDEIHSFLNEVKEFGSDNSQLNATIFKYNAPTINMETVSSQGFIGEILGTGDFNGDGFKDVLTGETFTYYNNKFVKKIRVYRKNKNDNLFTLSFTKEFLSTEFYYYLPISHQKQHSFVTTMDATGDNRDEIILVKINTTTSGNLDFSKSSFKIFQPNEDATDFVTSPNPPNDDISGDFKANFGNDNNCWDILPRDNDNKIQDWLHIGDFDGDGKSDFLAILNPCSNVTNIVKAIIFTPSTTNPYRFHLINIPVGNAAADWVNSSKISLLDFNGDGKTDIMITKVNANSLSRKVFALIPNILTSEPFLEEVADEIYSYSSSNPSFIGETDFQLGDFNGDGKSDILGFNKSTSSWYLYRSTGKTLIKDATTPFNTEYNIDDLTSFPIYDVKSKYSKFEIVDFNGDGLSDVVLTKTTFSYKDNYNRKATISYIVYLSDGNGFIIKNFTDNRYIADIDNSYFFTNNKQFRVNQVISDFNGDGRTDILTSCRYVTSNGNGDLIEYGYPSIISSNPLLKLGSLEKIADGFNQVTQIDYKYLTEGSSIYTKNAASSYPINVIDAPIKVVSSVTVPNGIGGTTATTYKYENAKVHRGGLGFLGFTKFQTDNVVQDIRSVTEFEVVTSSTTPQYIATAVKKQTVKRISNDALLSESTNTNSIKVNGTRYWQKVDATNSTDGLTGATSDATYVYDDYGNVTNEVVNVNNIETITNTKTFGSTYGTPVPAHPEIISVQKKRSNMSFPTENVSVCTYNNKGDLTSKIDKSRELGIVVEISTTNYTYNPTIGFLTNSAMYSNGIAPRYESFGYDSKGRFPTSITNTLNQTASKTYDSRWGTVLTETDITGLTTTHFYDEFGRVIKTKTPQNTGVADDINTQYLWSYDAEYLPVKCYDIVTTVPRRPTTWDIYDVFGRKTVATHENYGDPNHRWVYTYAITEYDAKGNVSKKSTPVNATDWYTDLEYTTYQYDGLNRLTSETTSIGATNYAYDYSAGNTTVTVTSPAAQVNSKTTDATGKTIATTDHGGTLTFEYDNRGNQTNVKMNDNVITSMTYDGKGYQTTLTDQNAGTTQYSYNNYGQLTWQRDANGNEYTMNYDNIGRLTTRTGAEGTTTNEYVTSGNGLNQIKKVTNFNGILQEYTYDNFHRVATAKETIEGTAYTKSFSYNKYNDLEKTTYPSGLVIKNTYSSDGYLFKVEQENGQMLFDGTNGVMSGFGKWRSYKLGNNIVSNITYNNFAMPTRYQAYGKQDLVLDWGDLKTGNLVSRTDNIKSKTESFTYDNLNRLRTAVVTGLNSYAFDMENNGNIWQKSDAGYYFYDVNKPNAVSDIYYNTFWFGGTIPAAQQNITYTKFQRPDKITEGGYELNFLYASDYERRKTVLKQNGNVVNTRYFMGDYEIDIKNGVTREIHYISGGDGLCAIVVKENGSFAFNFPYTDHLGSILTVTNASGAVIAEQNFDAWGRKRNVTTWDYANIGAVPDWLYRGYTGHEHLPEFGLINMNARLYDPVLGRMLSPDNYVGDGGTQGFNRYSYASNNPLNRVDPDGNNPMLIGALIGAGIDLGIQLWNNGGKLSNVNWTSVGTSALAGAVGSGFGSAAGAWAAKAINIGSSVVKGAVVGAIGGAVGGGAGGLTAGYLNGQTGWQLAKTAGWGAFTGGVIGGAFGAWGGRHGAKNTGNLPDDEFNGSRQPHGASHGSSSEGYGIEFGELNGHFDEFDDGLVRIPAHDIGTTSVAEYYPRNGGALGKWESKFLMPGTLIDRYGSGFGKYFSPVDVPMDMRALPYGNRGDYNVFKVIKPFEVQSSTIAPAFNKLGLGTQYLSPVNMNTLLKRGIIIRIK